MFLLSDGSLIWTWSASFAQWCRVLLSLSIIVKSLSSAFGLFCWDVVISEGTGGLISMVWNSFFQGPVVFTYCIQLWSCWLGIFSGRLYQFYVHLELDLLDAWVKTWCVLVPLKKTLTLYFARVCLYCSLRPLMYGVTILAPSINFPVDRFGFLLVFCWRLACWRNCAG